MIMAVTWTGNTLCSLFGDILRGVSPAYAVTQRSGS